MAAPHHPKQNQLLAALPAAEFKRLLPHLELAPMPLGESYYEPGGKLQYVYFPTTAIVSLHYVMENGAPAEIAGVGKEGMLGISLFMGDKAMPKRAFVRTVGYGYRLKARLLMDEFNRAETLQHLLLAYTKALITQASQTAVCNRIHSVEQKLCRWLLGTLDGVPSEDMVITQGLLANMLGEHRDVITEALRVLQQEELIRLRLDHIFVTDRYALERRACDCYGVIRKEFDRLFELDSVSGSAASRAMANSGTCAVM